MLELMTPSAKESNLCPLIFFNRIYLMYTIVILSPEVIERPINSGDNRGEIAGGFFLHSVKGNQKNGRLVLLLP